MIKSLFSAIARPFKFKATGVDGFKYCAGDTVLIKDEGKATPVKVLRLWDNLDRCFLVGVESINGQKTQIFSGDVYDPKSIYRFIGSEVSVKTTLPEEEIVKATIRDFQKTSNNKMTVIVEDKSGKCLQVTANCILGPEGAEATRETFPEWKIEQPAPPVPYAG